MKNLTPQHLRCRMMYCPSVHELDNGQLLIVGKKAEHLIPDKVGPDEHAITIRPELLEDIVRNQRKADD